MGRLSHIEDFENGDAAASPSQPAPSNPSVAERPAPGAQPRAQAPAPAPERKVSAEEFHGLERREKASLGHTVLIIAAAVVFAATVLYVAYHSLDLL